MNLSEVWKSAQVTHSYLEGVRAAIPLAAEQIDVLLRLLHANPRPITRFLDLGCGDGVLSAAILSAFPSAHATLLDFSEPMLHAARKRLVNSPHAAFLNLDYSDPTWPTHLNGPFDAIVSGFSIHHQPDPVKRRLYQQCFQLLAPGAMFLNLEHVSSPTPWLESIYDNLMIDCLHGLNPTQPRTAVESAYHNRPDKAANILAPLDAQLQWLRDAGFTHVDCYLKIFELALFGGRA